jgi:hypothetical protein
MASTYRMLFNGAEADDDLYAQTTALEVEENADGPAAIEFTLPVSADDAGDLAYVNDDRFKPFANVAVVVSSDEGSDQCIFDGYVLTHKLHLGRGTTGSSLTVWGQDASWLMNLEEKVKQWVDVTDADVANAVFSDYGITPSPDNTEDDSPSHTEDGHSLMQRASDIQFLRNLARRNGKLCRVTCADTPGQRVGYFAKPSLGGDPEVTFELNDPDAWNVDALDFEWDVTRPTEVSARQALFNDDDPDGASGGTNDSGLDPLDSRTLAEFAGKDMVVVLTTPVDDAQELTLRAQSVLREAGWFARCEGEADVARLNGVLRPGMIVLVNGAGSLNSGKYLVWSVRHSITAESHKMKFTLVRNAVGPAPSGGSLLGGLL